VENCTRRKVVCALASTFGTVSLAAIGASFYISLNNKENLYNDRRSDEIEVFRIRESDVIFVIGTSFVSSLIRASQVPFIYTHAGLLVMEKNRLTVIDSDYDPDLARDGVSLQYVSDFVRKVDSILVLSNPDLLPDQRRLISQAALSFRGKKFDLALKPDVDRLYCTELIARALMALPESPISFGSENYLTPASLHDTLLAKGWTSQVLTKRLLLSNI
jgi:hypothetical protein